MPIPVTNLQIVNHSQIGWSVLLKVSSRPDILNVGDGYEGSWETSKDQTKIPRFMLKGPRLCTIFCFHTLCMNKVVTKTFLLVSFSVWSELL